jgi:hypothetical protein
MGLKSVLLASFFALAFIPAASAEPSCLPEFNSLQVLQTMDLDASNSDTFLLKSENASGIFVSKARLSYVYDFASKEIKLRFHFDDDFDGVSLPYNVYAYLILQNGEVAAWYDLTGSCRGPGVGFYPGQNFSPPPLKVDGAGKQNFQFIVWGRIG